MVKGREELSDIKGKNTHVALSEPASPDKMSEVYSCICCGLLPDTPELMRVKEAIGWKVELKPIADGFLNEFACGVE